MSEQAPFPILLEPILKEKVWGGDRLREFEKQVAHGDRIGESWELADLDSTSASGGGGGEAVSKILGGPLDGKPLRDAIELWGDELIHSKRLLQGRFPLLVKYLDAREHLSVQVHPSPEYAETHPEARLKTECWFVLRADPLEDGSKPVIYKGVKEGIDADEFRRRVEVAARTGKEPVDEADSVPASLQEVPAKPGDMHLLPSGTVHALGAGVLVAEIQTPSDTTFRVYDWAKEYGREGRELHIEESMACIDFGRAPEATSLGKGKTRGVLCDTQHFSVERVVLNPDQTIEFKGGRCLVVMVLDGGIELHGRIHYVGATLVIPRAWSGKARCENLARLLVVTVGNPKD